MEIQYINHKEYQMKTALMPDSALRYTIKDASAAIAANPDGHKAGYYADEINYCAMELQSRRVEYFGRQYVAR